MFGSFFETDNVLEYVTVSKEPFIRIAVLKSGACLVDKDNIKLSNVYRRITQFKNGVAVAYNHSFAHVIDLEGKELFDRPYSEVRLDNDVICINEDGLWGIATYDGRVVVNPQYEYIEPFKDSVAMMKNLQGDWGIISHSSFILVAPTYKTLIRLNSNFFLAEDHIGYGIIDYKGRNIVPLKYCKYELSQDKVVLTDKNGKTVTF